MAANKTDYAENKIVELLTGKTAFSKPTTYIALLTSNPGESGDLTGEVPTSGGTLYARQALTVDAAANGVTQNSAEVAFPVAGASWGAITHIAIVDSASAGAGNVLYYGALTSSRTIGTGEQFRIQQGQLTFTET
jgi:hypothetical protein